MLAKRVIPCMDVKDGRVVKGVNFVNLRDAGDPIELAQRYDEQRADEVIFLDITATSDKRETTVDLASRASAQLHLPYCVGGGFRSVADIRRMIAAGADKVYYKVFHCVYKPYIEVSAESEALPVYGNVGYSVDYDGFI